MLPKKDLTTFVEEGDILDVADGIIVDQDFLEEILRKNLVSKVLRIVV